MPDGFSRRSRGTQRFRMGLRINGREVELGREHPITLGKAMALQIRPLDSPPDGLG